MSELQEYTVGTRLKFVGIEGPISGGKSRLAAELSQHLDGLYGLPTRCLEEPADQEGIDGKKANPFLDDYYAETDRLKDPNEPRPLASTAFLMQIHLFVERFHIHEEAYAYVKARRGCAVVDRVVTGDSSFAHVQLQQRLMAEREFGVYARLYEAMMRHVPLPTVLVNLQVAPEVCIERIHRRSLERTGRRCEKVIGIDYLRHLQREIDYMIDVMRQRGVTVLDRDWNADLGTGEARRPHVAQLARDVYEARTINSFLDLHRGIV